MKTAIVRAYTYLKRPLYSWSIINKQGGSFSNSGQVPSWNNCVDHLREVAGLDVRFRTYTIDADGNETLDEEKSNY